MKSKPIQITEVKGSLNALCSDGSIWVYNNEWVNIFTMDKKAPGKSGKVNNIKEREAIFKESLREFLKDYSVEMVKAFYEFWSEPDPSNVKMRFERENTWDIGRRIKRWYSQDNNRGNSTVKQSKNNTPKYDPNEAKIGLEALKRSGQLIDINQIDKG